MPRRLRIGLALALCIGGVSALTPGAHANGPCGSPPCYTEFTVDGAPPPSGVSLNVMETGGMVQALLTTTPGFNFELSPALSNDSAVHYTLNLGDYDPAAFVTTGFIDSYIPTSGSPNVVAVDAFPRSSSWTNSCRVGNCGTDANPLTASVDYSSMLIGAITDLSGAPSPGIAAAMHGTWISTNAQAFSMPTFNPVTQQLSFSVAAPHFKSNGTTVNTGFFTTFMPDALVHEMGIPGPSSVNVTNSTGGGLATTVTHVDSPPGLLIDATGYSYSSPTFKVVKGNPADATLRKLAISAGHLTPTFSPSRTSYNAGAVGTNIRTVKVTPTVNQSSARIQARVNNGAFAKVASGKASKAFPLSVGANKVYVRVTAPNKTTPKTYAIAIKRNAAR